MCCLGNGLPQRLKALRNDRIIKAVRIPSSLRGANATWQSAAAIAAQMINRVSYRPSAASGAYLKMAEKKKSPEH